jgi:O-acetyl-ADP-ribose deacetylase (regulator of RNase III)
LLQGTAATSAIQDIWGSIRSEWWNAVDGSKRRIMAECLVPQAIPPDLLETVYVADHSTAQRVRSLIGEALPIVPEPHMFFRPSKRYLLAPQLSLVEGDMFFSAMQTLTVSVNTVGVMGRGLASRAKHQFPDVYVHYQDACRSKAVAMGQPVLYKRESFIDAELADEPASLYRPNARKWFLLFPTKAHWRNASDINAIGAGLEWITSEYRRQGIQSLALPALGCGLGGLEWKDVGPLMCRELSRIDVPVVIYLPREREIAPEYLSPRYLTGHDFVREEEVVYEA